MAQAQTRVPLPEFSVVIPNFNHAAYLPVCLEAVLAQSVLPAEILVIDDASTDNSLEVIERFARQHPRIRVLRNEQNQGVVYGMNLGLREARNDYVYYAAADDQVVPGLFEKSLQILAAHPQAALCCTIGDWREMDSGLHWHVGVGMANRPTFLSPADLVRLERQDRLFIDSHTSLLKRSVLLDVGGFIPALRWHCDWFALHVAAFRHGLCFVPEPLAIAKIRSTSFHTAGRRGAAHREVLRRILALLTDPDFRDVAEALRNCGGLYLFGWPMFKLLIGCPEGRGFLAGTFLRKNFLHIAKLLGKQALPRWAADWYFRMAGYRAGPREHPSQST